MTSSTFRGGSSTSTKINRLEEDACEYPTTTRETRRQFAELDIDDTTRSFECLLAAASDNVRRIMLIR